MVYIIDLYMYTLIDTDVRSLDQTPLYDNKSKL
jgi:hypothetical protein